MKANIGPVDRVVRVIVGLVILGLGIYCRSWWGLIGLIPLITAVIGICPGYLPFGISTCRKETEAPPSPPSAPSHPV